MSACHTFRFDGMLCVLTWATKILVRAIP